MLSVDRRCRGYSLKTGEGRARPRDSTGARVWPATRPGCPISPRIISRLLTTADWRPDGNRAAVNRGLYRGHYVSEVSAGHPCSFTLFPFSYRLDAHPLCLPGGASLGRGQARWLHSAIPQCKRSEALSDGTMQLGHLDVLKDGYLQAFVRRESGIYDLHN